MANVKNLRQGNPETQFKSGQNAVENGRKGGIASGESKRRKKDMRERLEILLSMPIKSGKEIDIEKIKSFDLLEDKNITVEDTILMTMIQKALKGDLSAVTFLRDTSGQKCAEKVEITQSIDESIIEIEKYMKGE